MKIRVTLMTENDIDANDVMTVCGLSKEEFMKQVRASWDIAIKLIVKNGNKCSCESVELVEV